MSKTILCFGDSNTYGFDPRPAFGGRLPDSGRWTAILDKQPEWHILAYGENGREIPHSEWAFQELDAILGKSAPFDCFCVMLGTNDLFQVFQPTAERITARMRQLLLRVLAHPAITGQRAKVLLLAPPIAQLSGGGAAEEALSALSVELCATYAALAQEMRVEFADTSQWRVQMAFDGVHIAEEGHRVFAREMQQLLQTIFQQ